MAHHEAVLAAVGDGWPRLTYDEGLLELRMPSQRHESTKWTAGRFVEAYMDAADIDYEAVGSMTLRQESIAGGLEPDESYYIQSFALVTGKEIGLAVDPPPDLAVEIDLSPPALAKERRFGSSAGGAASRPGGKLSSQWQKALATATAAAAPCRSMAP